MRGLAPSSNWAGLWATEVGKNLVPVLGQVLVWCYEAGVGYGSGMGIDF
jgi:hypothetical protein